MIRYSHPLRQHLEGVTHGIILVCGGDSNIDKHLRSRFEDLRDHFERGESPKVAVYALVDLYEAPAEVHCFCRGSHFYWPIGEVGIADKEILEEFIAGGLELFSKITHIALGFVGHGDGVLRDFVVEESGGSQAPEEREPGVIAEPGASPQAVRRGGRSPTEGEPSGRSFQAPSAATPREPQLGSPLGAWRDFLPFGRPSPAALRRAIGATRGWVQRGLFTALEGVRTTLGGDKNRITDPQALANLKALRGKATPKRPKGREIRPSPNALTTVEIADVLGAAWTSSDRESRIDLLFFNSCHNGMVEVAYEVRRFAETFVGAASRDPEPLWDYRGWLHLMGPEGPQTAHEWATQALSAFEAASECLKKQSIDKPPWALAALDVDKLPEVTEALAGLVTRLRDLDITFEGLSHALHASQNFDGREVRDLYDIAEKLATQHSDVSMECDAIKRAVESAVVHRTIVLQKTDEEVHFHGVALWAPWHESHFAGCRHRRQRKAYRKLRFEQAAHWFRYLEG